MSRSVVPFTILALVAYPPASAPAAPGDNVERPPKTSERESTPSLAAPATMREVLLRERRALESEKAELEQLKIDLEAAEAAVDAKIAALEKVVEEQRQVVENIRALKNDVLDEKILRLIKLTEKMPPVEAAAYLTKLDEATASTILQGMKIRQASKVMAALHAKKAASLSRTYLKDDKPVGRRPSGD